MGNREKVVVCAFLSGFGWEMCRRYKFLDDYVTRKLPLTTFLGAEESCVPVILTGRLPFETGHLSPIVFDPQNSPYKALRLFRWFPPTLTLRGGMKLNRYVIRLLCSSAGYDRLFRYVPVKYLPFFSKAAKNDVYTRDGINSGVPTMFDYFTENSIPFFMHDRKISDAANAEKLKGQLSHNDISFAFVAFSGIKTAASSAGTDDAAVDVAVRQTEKLLRNVLQTAQERYKDVVFFFFSDQGMADITMRVDIETKIRETGLVFGKDYIAFYEPTMVRFWFLTADAKESIIDVLEETSEGNILSDYDLEELSCLFPDRRFGDLFFLMKSGFAIFPNYMNNGEIKATCGYSPYDRHSIACFGTSEQWGREPVQLSDLFGLILDAVRY